MYSDGTGCCKVFATTKQQQTGGKSGDFPYAPVVTGRPTGAESLVEQGEGRMGRTGWGEEGMAVGGSGLGLGGAGASRIQTAC